MRSEKSGCRRLSSRATASPTIPAPTIAMSHSPAGSRSTPVRLSPRVRHHPGIAEGSGNEILFAYDLGSPYAWLAAERVDEVLPSTPEWLPVLLGGIFKARGRRSWAEGLGRSRGIAEVERRAKQRGLGTPRWPEPWPSDGLRAMRAAVRAHELGAGKRFALSAFRTHFMEGHTLADDGAIAAAARYADLDADE